MFFRNFRHAARLLARNPGSTAVAALSLAIGIGANTAIFSFHDALLWRPLPVRDPGRVVTVSASSQTEAFNRNVSYPNYRDLRERSASFDGLVAHQLSFFSFARSRRDVREMRMGMLVSDNFFDVLGVPAALGRVLRADEGQVPGRDAVVVLGYDFWKNALAGDRSVLNSVVPINGIDFTVVGVTPESFTGMDPYIRPAFFLPIVMAQRLSAGKDTAIDDRAARIFTIKGRLKPGTSQEHARAELTTLWNALARQFPDVNGGRIIAVRSELQERIQSDPTTAALIVMMTTLVGLVLVIACANVANLLLGRARARTREVAVRLALGISRMRLLGELLTESLLLAAIGGAAGLLFAYGGIRFFQAFQLPTDLPVVLGTELDMRVLVFSLAVALTSVVLFGIAPWWQSLRTPVVEALKTGEGGLTSKTRTIGRNVLVVTQIAISMVLLVAAGMLLDGFRRTIVLNPGFRTNHLVMLSTDTSVVGYTPVQTHAFYRDLVDRARALPGVASVALTSAVPTNPGRQEFVNVMPEGYQFPPGQSSAAVMSAFVDDHYFATMQIDILRGRAFATTDIPTSRRVAIVNEMFAKTYWPSQDPIGKRLRLDDGSSLEVVGLTKTGSYMFVGEPPRAFLYVPFAQDEKPWMSLVVETSSHEGAALAGPLRDIVHSLDVNQPVFNVRSFAKFYEQRTLGPRLLVMQVTTALGVLGLTLALIGLYGLVAYSVARRTREIGIRMAIGAHRSNVLAMVLRQGVTLAMIGIAIGTLVSLVLERLLGAAMQGLGSGGSPVTFVAVPCALLVLTVVASYVPALRAARVDPLRALRYE